MFNGDLSEINIIYNINREKDNIRIFGPKFVENNKNICKMIIDNKEYEITEEYNIKNYNENKLNIKLKGINNASDISFIFYKCQSLLSLPDISKLNTNNVINMSAMFAGCSSLSFLPDISKWLTNNVTNMNGILAGCSSLTSLPDISKWNTNNVTNIKGMFAECSSLTSLPEFQYGKLIILLI